MVDERTPEDRERLGRIVDGLPAWKVIQIINSTVGAKRGGELMLWALWWDLTGEPAGAALATKLKAQGLTNGSTYRAMSDFRKIGDALLAEDAYHGPGVFASMRTLAAQLGR